MSLWSPERAQLFLGPEGSWLTRVKRGRVERLDRLPAVRDVPDLDAVAQTLQTAEWRRLSFEVLLSHRQVRFVLTEPPRRLIRRAEEEALAAAEFARIYGQSDRLRLRIASQPPEAGILGAAVEEGFAQAVEAMMDSAGIRRYTLRPWLEAAVQRPEDGWTVLIEPGWAFMGLAQSGLWRHVQAQPCSDDWAERLPDWLVRAERLQGTPIPRQARVRRVAGRAPRFAWPSGWTIDALAPLFPEATA